LTVVMLVAELLRPAAPRTPETFLTAFLQAIRARDVKGVAGLFQYPFRLNAPGIPYPIAVNSPAELARLYDIVFNPTMRCAIETSRVPSSADPHPAYKLAMVDGVVTIADGRVVAVRTNDVMKITRMTLLMGSKAPARPPQRLSPSSRTQASGRLAYDDRDIYLLSLKAGSELTATIEEFPGRSLLLRVREAATNALVRGAATEFSRKWVARAPQGGDYRIEVVRNTAYCDPEVTYVLTVAVR
jgi:hypothetical protein